MHCTHHIQITNINNTHKQLSIIQLLLIYHTNTTTHHQTHTVSIMKLFRLLEFDEIKSFLLTKKQTCISIDLSSVYCLHYRATVLILIAFCLLVTARQFFGDPIDCVVNEKEEHFEKVINRYCWIQTTFSVESAWHKPVGSEVAYPGVDKATPDDVVIYHAYYQWVWLLLLLQAFLFYVPYIIWEQYEGNITNRLLNGLNSGVMSQTDRMNKISKVSEYLYRTKNHHTFRFLIYTSTEMLNLFNVVMQMLLLDRFLGGKFLNYGFQVFNFNGWTQFPLQYDPMMKLFPRMTKCTFHQFGSSGDIQKHDTICVLPINIVNEKTYLFLWFWLILLMIATFCLALWRILSIMCPCIRVIILQANCSCSRSDVQQVLKYNGIGDWFVLCLLAKNMEKNNFKVLIADLTVRMKQKKEKKLNNTFSCNTI